MSQPDYYKLKCPKCGNTSDFVEFAQRETKQRFEVKANGVDWEAFEALDDVHPDEIVCGICYHREMVQVWKSVEPEDPSDPLLDVIDSTGGVQHAG